MRLFFKTTWTISVVVFCKHCLLFQYSFILGTGFIYWFQFFYCFTYAQWWWKKDTNKKNESAEEKITVCHIFTKLALFCIVFLCNGSIEGKKVMELSLICNTDINSTAHTYPRPVIRIYIYFIFSFCAYNLHFLLLLLSLLFWFYCHQINFMFGCSKRSMTIK